MSEELCSVLFSRAVAAEAFRGVAPWRVVLAALAGMRPEPGWEGCQIYEAAPTDDRDEDVCVVVRGPAARQVATRLTTALGAVGIPVHDQRDGGLDPRGPIAEARSGEWGHGRREPPA